MTPAARVRSNTARSLDRALFAIGALSAFIVLIELALLLQTAQQQTAATLFLPFGFAIYVVAARFEERLFAGTALAPDYAAYRKKAGLFWPKP